MLQNMLTAVNTLRVLSAEELKSRISESLCRHFALLKEPDGNIKLYETSWKQ